MGDTPMDIGTHRHATMHSWVLPLCSRTVWREKLGCDGFSVQFSAQSIVCYRGFSRVVLSW